MIFISFKLIDNFSIFLSIIKKFLTILSPFIYALIFAYILNPVMKVFEKKFKFKRSLSVGLTYILVLVILIIIGIYGIPLIIDSIISITKEIPYYISISQDWIDSLLKNDSLYKLMSDSGILQTLTSLSTKAGSILVSLLNGTVNSLLTITTNLIMFIFGFLISIYILLDKEKFIKHSKLILIMITGKIRGNKIINALNIYNDMIGNYIGVKSLDSLIIGSISLIGLYALNMPYFLLLAILVGFTNMIPYFGPFIGMLVCALVAVFISPWKAFAVIIFLLALQQFDAWYLEPKLVSDKVGVTPFLIVLGVTIGGGFFGPIGMLLASPTVATIKIYYDKFISKKSL
ncbi:AI-2E family transporter [Clostridium baratii]|uniref:AI-2E family transporter n=1 Tax=Clostridium baratii TaxID=1561 RepID=UPI0030D343D0